MTLKSVSKQELFDLLAAAIDGIDGYECETGDSLRRYWDTAKISRAREIIDGVNGGAPAWRSTRELWLNVPESPQ